jgi:L-methionine (R)-S-oxide reductase
MSIEQEIREARDLDDALTRIIGHFHADSGTIHLIENDGLLHLKAASRGMPEAVLNIIKVIPIGKGMAGLAAQRREPVTVCNLQTDTSGDVRPGAKKTGMEGAIVVPIFDGDQVVGTLGIATRNERTYSDDETALLIECGRAIVDSRNRG